MTTEQLLTTTGESVTYAKEYIDLNIEATKLEVSRRIALTTSGIITSATIAILATLTLLFASISLGFFLGKWWDSYALSFLAITGLYLILALVIYRFQRPLITDPITSSIIKNLLQ